MRAPRRALAYLRSYRRAAVGAFVALLVVTAANLVAPQLLRLAIDRGLAAIVLQEPFLFSGTVADTIGFGRAGASRR